MFELLVSLCLGAVCDERVLPVRDVHDRAACEATAQARVAAWVAAHDGYVPGAHRCVALSELATRTAGVVETAPGHFVHEGQIAVMEPGGTGDLANTGFIVGETAVAVIDAGTTRGVGEALYLAVRRATDKPIRHLLLTHMHPDHSLGAEVFREAGAEIVGSAALEDAIASRAEAYMANLARLLDAETGHGTAVALPDRGIEGEASIDLGGRVLHLKTYPTAHTNNDMTVLDSASRTIWMGDLVFLMHTPAVDGSIRGWIELLQGLDPEAAAHMVPGHGPPVAIFPDGADPTRAYLEALVAETRAAIAKGDSLGTAVPYLGLGLRGGWKLFDDFNPRNATVAYDELEWE